MTMTTESFSDQVNEAVTDQVLAVKKAVTAPFPHPPSFSPISAPADLKQRLDWGEPALTVLDIRDREAFAFEHIKGAMCMPLADEFVNTVSEGLEQDRDIYLYSDADQQTAEAASLLQGAGFTRVSQVQGGLSAWKAINGPVEGYNAP